MKTESISWPVDTGCPYVIGIGHIFKQGLLHLVTSLANSILNLVLYRLETYS